MVYGLPTEFFSFSASLSGLYAWLAEVKFDNFAGLLDDWPNEKLAWRDRSMSFSFSFNLSAVLFGLYWLCSLSLYKAYVVEINLKSEQEIIKWVRM